MDSFYWHSTKRLNGLAQARARRFIVSFGDVCRLTQFCRQNLRTHHSIVRKPCRFWAVAIHFWISLPWLATDSGRTFLSRLRPTASCCSYTNWTASRSFISFFKMFINAALLSQIHVRQNTHAVIHGRLGQLYKRLWLKNSLQAGLCYCFLRCCNPDSSYSTSLWKCALRNLKWCLE